MTKSHDDFERPKARPDGAQREELQREEVQKSLARWGTLPVPVAPSDVLDQRQKRGLATLRASIGSAKRESQARRMRFFMGAVAAVALAVWGGAHVLSSTSAAGGLPFASAGPQAFVDGPCEVSQGQAGWVRSVPGRAVSTGDRVRALTEPVSVRLDRITSAHVAPTAVLGITALAERRQELRLLSGTAEFEVDPKRAAEVVVRTESARILVTGTAFSVTAGGAGSGAWSEVVVTRGRVEIASRGETFVLDAGEAWSSRDGESELPSTGDTLGTKGPRMHPSTPSEGSDVRAEVSAASPAERDLTGRSSREGRSGAAAASGEELDHADGRSAERTPGEAATTTLSEENRLLRAALSARNSGNDTRCVALLADLLSRFPGSPLRQEAIVAQFRCLRSSGNVATAQRVAQRYLSDYPNGFARDEARKLIVGVER